MEFTPTENQQMIAQTVKDFAEKHIRPNVMKWDESQEFPVDVFKKMGEIGLMGILVPEEYGGAGLGYFEYVTAIVEVARVCGSVGLSMAAHNSLCTGHIMAFGNEADLFIQSGTLMENAPYLNRAMDVGDLCPPKCR